MPTFNTKHSQNVMDLLIQPVGHSLNESTISVVEQVAEVAIGYKTFFTKINHFTPISQLVKRKSVFVISSFS